MLTFVGLVLGTATVLTLVAYRSSQDTLEGVAQRTVHVAAQKLEQILARLVEARQERARGFLDSVESLCGELGPSGTTAFEVTCVKTALAEFRATEHAAGAVLEQGARRVAQSGSMPRTDLAVPAVGARLVRRGREFDYIVRVSKGHTSLTIEFPTDEFVLFFGVRSGLGEHGEAFLMDRSGQFVTPPRYGAPERPLMSATGEPVGHCSHGPSEFIDLDYRGVRTVHGYRPATVFFDGACVDVHVAYDEALAPAERLWNDLTTRAVLFALIGLLVSLLASRWIAAPVRRLVLSAKALEAGEFDRPVPIVGPSEVRALARGFQTMAASLSDLIAREQTARREAETANRTKDEFLATVSHELRSPLTAILGWSWLLRARKLRGADADQALQAIERSANVQSRLIEDLLDVSRIIVDGVQLNRRPTSLVDPISAALEAIRPNAENKGVTIHSHLNGSMPPVFGDPPRLQQIVSNLLTNAVKFTPAGGRIEVEVKPVDRMLELAISDTGIGIAAEFLPHVFDRFRQADSAATRTRMGLGLGLAIARDLVALHGGEIRAVSTGVGRGATFTVRLPIYDVQGDTQAEIDSAADDLDAASPRLDQIRVLLVDDDEDTLMVVRAILEEAGASVATAASADEARATLATWHPTILVSDIAMPHEDGYALIRSLRARHTTVPAIALTAHSRRENAAEARAAGFQMFMAKPVQRRDLVNGIAALAKTTLV